MPALTTSGQTVSSANIADGSIVDVDISASAAIGQNKIAPGTSASTDLFVIETTNAATHSLTTVAGQRVVVFGKGDITNVGTGPINVTLDYNAVTKDTVSLSNGGGSYNIREAFSLMYTEVPGAGTQNVVINTSGGSMSNARIIVMKFRTT